MSKAVYNNPPSLKSNIFSSFVLGILIAGGLFLLLPLSQLIEADQSQTSRNVDNVVTPPPPPPPPEIMRDEEKVEQEDVEEMEEPPPPPSLAMLELSLNADLGGIGSGDMQMPSFDVAESIDEMIFTIAELDEPPQYKVTKEPVYPPDMKRAEIQGTVYVECVIDEKGNVMSPRIHKTDNQGFNDAALKAIRKWKLTPGRIDGKPVKFKVRIPMVFSIKK